MFEPLPFSCNLDFMFPYGHMKEFLNKPNILTIRPKFIITKSRDMMVRGSDFYAVWVEAKGRWSTDEQDALTLIDSELDRYAELHKGAYGDCDVRVLHMWDAESGMIDAWHKYCQRQMRDNYVNLDEKIIPMT